MYGLNDTIQGMLRTIWWLRVGAVVAFVVGIAIGAWLS